MTEEFTCWTRCDKSCQSNMKIKPNFCEKDPNWRVNYSGIIK